MIDYTVKYHPRLLDEILFEAYGNLSKWDAVVEANPGVFSKGIRLPVGTVVKLPVDEDTANTPVSPKIQLWGKTS